MKSAIITILLFAGVANATPVTWTVNDAFFGDGTQITGSFTYDASINTYSNVALQTSWWDYGASGYVHDYSTSTALHVTEELEFSFENECQYRDTQTHYSCFTIGLQFAEALTNAGGIVALNGSASFGGEAEWDWLNNTIGRGILAGGTVSAVPIPAAVWLFGSALAGLGWFRRKTA
jgi:hypothetical protein